MAYPLLSDMVIVWGSWFDERTRQGETLPVTFTPLVSPASSETPLLTVVAENAWIKTREWKVTPDPATGFFAVPLTPNNDPDVTAFSGYRITPGGETPRTAEVPADADTMTVTAQLRDYLQKLSPPISVTIGDTVKAKKVTELALIDPAPVPPESFFDAAATTAAIASGILAHDTDPEAHPDIRDLIGTSGGGGPYAVKSVEQNRIRVADFGAKSDGRHANDAQISSTNFGAGAGPAVVRSTAVGFTSDDVGKTLMTVTDYNSGYQNSCYLGAAIPSGTLLSAATTITLGAALTNALPIGAPVWLMAYGVRYTTTLASAASAGATSITVNPWTVQLYNVTTFTAGAPASGSDNAAWLMFPVSTTVLGTIASVVTGVSATLASGSAPTASASSLTVYVGTDDTAAINQAIAYAQRSYGSATPDAHGKGGLVELPRGITLITGVLQIDGAQQFANVMSGGVGVIGQGPRATSLVMASLSQAGIAFGAANTTTGSTSQTVSNVVLRDFALLGPGMMHQGTVAIDKRVSGGSYRYENLFIDSFDIGCRHHDMYTFVGANVVWARCALARAIGFQGDIQQWDSPYATKCLIDLYLGYTDPARSQVPGSNGWRAHSERGGVATGCHTGVYVEGYAIQGSLTVESRHNEYFADVAFRIGDSAQAHAVQGSVDIIDSGYNAPRPIADMFGPAGRVKHAVEVNWAFSVNIHGGYASRTSDAPIVVRNTVACVRAALDTTEYDPTDNVAGDVLLPDATYGYCVPPAASPSLGSAAQKTAFTYGRWAPHVAFVSGLPSGTQLSSGAWLHRTLVVKSTGVAWHCELVSGTPTWVQVPSTTSINDAIAATGSPSGPTTLAQILSRQTVTNTTVKTPVVSATIPGGTIQAGHRVEFVASGYIAVAATSGTLTFTIEVDGVGILWRTMNSQTSATSGQIWYMSGELDFRSSGSVSLIGGGLSTLNNLGGTIAFGITPQVVNTTDDLTVTINATWASANTANNLSVDVARLTLAA